MSNLSQFSVGNDRFRLKVKNGPYVFDNIVSNNDVHIRDFTAQNDSLMISLTRGDVYIGKRVDQLYPAVLYATVSGSLNRDTHIGGDPYADVTSINRAGIAKYVTTNTVDLYRAPSGRMPQVTFDGGPNIGYPTTITTALASNTLDDGFGRFIYTSNDELFFIHWRSATEDLDIFRWDTAASTFQNATWTYGGSTEFSSSGTFQGITNSASNLTGVIDRCSQPEIDPSTGNIFMLLERGGSWFRVQYSVSSGNWTILDVTTGPSNFPAGPTGKIPFCIAIDNTGNNMLLTTGSSQTSVPASAKYWNSTDGGNTWTERSLVGTNLVMRQAGYANGKFYSINTSSESATAQHGDLISVDTADLGTPSSWVFEQTDISRCVFLRNNGLGTACYVSTGGRVNQSIRFQPQHGILRLTGNS